MAEWVCSACGYVRDSRCKPRKCPQCGSSDGFDRVDEARGIAKKGAAVPEKAAKESAAKNISMKGGAGRGSSTGKSSAKKPPAGKAARD